MQFMLHMNGDFRGLAKEAIAEGLNRPAMKQMVVELDDVSNVRAYMATGYALSDIQAWVTDMDGNELTESPWSYLAFPAEVFLKVKPAKTKKSYRNKYHYSFTVNAEVPENLNPSQPMEGTISIVDSSSMTLSWNLSMDSLKPKAIGQVGKNHNEWLELPQEEKHKFADGWDGTMTVKFNAKYLLQLVEAQNGEDESSHVALTVNVYNQIVSQPPMMIVNSNLSAHSPAINVGFLMPIMSKKTEFIAKTLEYLRLQTAKRLLFGEVKSEVKAE
jgi:hypothetical protein